MSLVTEGYIKTISIKNKVVTFKIEPIEPYIFVEGDKTTKKILFKKGSGFESVEVTTDFYCSDEIKEIGFDVNSLLVLKLNRGKIQLTCKKSSKKYSVADIEIL